MDPLRPLLRLLAPLFLWRHWPRLRAAIVLFHVVAVVAVACPAPVKAGTKKQWERPSVRAEIHNWQGRLRAVGVDVSEEQLAAFGFETSQRWSAARASLIRPFLVYIKKIGALQGWYMFTAPDRHPQRLAVDLLARDGRREHVFTLGRAHPRSDVIDPAFLGEHRVRRVLFQTAWADRAPTMKDVCAWIGRRALARTKDTEEIECTQIEFQVDHPWKREKHPPDRATRTLRLPLTPEAEEAAAAAAQRAKAKKKKQQPAQQAQEAAP